MTFEEWWHENESALRFGIDFIAHRVLTGAELKESNEQMKRIANDVWQASQPKWTLCKDGMPKEKDGKVITTHETDASFYSHEIKVIRVYVKLETQNPFNETRIDNFCLSTNKFEKYEDLVIAWMPLPEV